MLHKSTNHDLKSPLTAFIILLEKELESQSLYKNMDNLKKMKAFSKRMMNLINDIVDYS
jgi:signal transduction histidine kinase